jgi:hypothetical protein
MGFEKFDCEKRYDLHSILIAKFGKRKLSESINKILAEHLFQDKKSLFGNIKKVDLRNLRNHRERL